MDGATPSASRPHFFFASLSWPLTATLGRHVKVPRVNPFTQLPCAVLACSLSACSAEELARLESCASLFHGSDAAFCNAATCATEYGALLALREKLAIDDEVQKSAAIALALRVGESWKLLWFQVASMASELARPRRAAGAGGRDHDQRLDCEREQQQGMLQVLEPECSGIGHVTPAHVQGLHSAVVSLVRRRRPSAAWASRAAALAHALGTAGRWTAGAQLMHAAATLAGSHQMDACGAVAASSLLQAELLTAASGFLVDKCYASTYVSSSDDENRDIVVAFDTARQAVELARASAFEANWGGWGAAAVAGAGASSTSLAAASAAASRVRGGPLQEAHAPTFVRGRAALAAALYAEGRASAICAQHKALGAMLADEDRATRLPRAAALFTNGQAALEEALGLAEAAEDSLGGARACAALAELWYCAASANIRGAAALIPGGTGHVAFERLAALPAGALPGLDAPEGNPGVLLGVGIVRLVTASLEWSATALRRLEDMGHAETLLGAQIMKDLGKVHGFATNFRPELYTLAGLSPSEDHGALADELLSRALAAQQRLQGAAHKNTANVRRLLGRHGVGTGGAQEEQRSEEQQSEEEDEAGAYLAAVETQMATTVPPAGEDPPRSEVHSIFVPPPTGSGLQIGH